MTTNSSMLPLEIVYEIIGYIPEYGYHVDKYLHNIAIQVTKINEDYLDYYRYCGLIILAEYTAANGIIDYSGCIKNCLEIINKDPRDSWEYYFVYSNNNDDEDIVERRDAIEKKSDDYEQRYHWIIKFFKKIGYHFLYEMLCGRHTVSPRTLMDVGIGDISRFTDVTDIINTKRLSEPITCEVPKLYAIMIAHERRMITEVQFHRTILQEIFMPADVVNHIVSKYGLDSHIRLIAEQYFRVLDN